jgi:hypothetical protein
MRVCVYIYIKLIILYVLRTGERATARTGEALKIDHKAAVENGSTLARDVHTVHKDEAHYYEDLSQARSVLLVYEALGY